ncbi:MAG: nucleotide exchange factor GrpE [Clostridiales Family XIII bacterium]|jgi:molecular chaperone GrpE|nr:nucleotide exchange factor GrpE [Clostridiales Family XIII bacterium]
MSARHSKTADAEVKKKRGAEASEEERADVGQAACGGDAEGGESAEDGTGAEAGTPGDEQEAAREASGQERQEDEALNLKYMRLAADFQNYKRRVEKEKDDILAFANERMAASLLDVLDNFERALEQREGAGMDAYAQGMEMIFKQLQDVLAKNQVEEMLCLGEDFDPARHHAVMMEEGGEYESGKVSAVLKKGYKLKEKVIRPAMVKVAQ